MTDASKLQFSEPSCSDVTCACDDRVEIFARALYNDARVDTWPQWSRLDEEYRAGSRDKWKERARKMMDEVGIAGVYDR